MRRRVLLGLLAALSACTPHGPGAVLSRTDQDDLARIGAYLNGLPHFQAHFVQSGDYGPGAGLVWLDRPGHLRVDFAGPGAPVLVIAEGRLRLLDRATGALTTQPVSRTPLGLLLAPSIELSGPVHVDSFSRGADGSTWRLALSKTGQSGQGVLTLDFAAAPLQLIAVSVSDPYGHVRTLALTGIDPGAAMPAGLFAPPTREDSKQSFFEKKDQKTFVR